jgi:hypothetical protein
MSVCTGPTCEWVAPWDEPWVKAHKLSKPMFVALYGLGVDQGHIYHQGQNRMIMAALHRRGLITHDGELTMTGCVLATWAQRAIIRAYPARPGEVQTR